LVVSASVLYQYLTEQAGSAVIRIRDPSVPPDGVFTGFFISPTGHLLTAYHALESQLLDTNYPAEFELEIEYDPLWLPADKPTIGPLSVTARCEVGWRNSHQDFALLKLDCEPKGFLPLSPPMKPTAQLGSPLRAYGFTFTQQGVPYMSQVDGTYFRPLPEEGRFRVAGIVRSVGQSGGPVVDLRSRTVVGTVVGFLEKEILTGDAVVIDQTKLARLATGIDLRGVAADWRSRAAAYLCAHQENFRLLSSKQQMPSPPERHLRDRAKFREVLGPLLGPNRSAVILHGGPGSGKTSLALEIVDRLRETGAVKSIFWHDFEPEANRVFDQLVRRIALHILEQDGNFEAIDALPPRGTDYDGAVSALLSGIHNSRHAFVFDNVHFLQKREREDRTEVLGLLDKVTRAAGDGSCKVLFTSWGLPDPPLAPVERVDGLANGEVEALLRLYGVTLAPKALDYIRGFRKDVTCIELLIRDPYWRDDIEVGKALPAESAELHRYWSRKYRERLDPAARRVLLALAVLAEPSGRQALEEVAEVEDFAATLTTLHASPPFVEVQQDARYHLHYNVERAVIATSDRRDVIKAHRLAGTHFERTESYAAAARHLLECEEGLRALNLIYERREKIIASGLVNTLEILAGRIPGSARDAPGSHFRLNVVLASCNNVRGRYLEAEKRWCYALSDAPNALDSCSIHNRRGDSFRLASDYAQARHEYEIVVLMGGEGDGERYKTELGRAKLGLAKLDRLRADYARARCLYQEAHVAFEQSFDVSGLIEAEFGLGEVNRLQQAWSESEEGYSSSLDRAREVGNVEREAYALWGLGEVQRLTRRYDQALSTHRNGLILCSKVGDARSEGWALLGLAESHREAGQIGPALIAYQDALSRFERTRSETECAHAVLGQAEARRSQGDVRLEWYKRSEDIYRRRQLRHSLILCVMAKAAVFRGMNLCREAARLIDEAIHLASECGLEYELRAAELMRDNRDSAPFLPLNFP
jgi:tetratricopeptide (TPR) repeat protein